MCKEFLLILLLLKLVDSKMKGFIMDGDFTKIQWYPHQVYLEIHGFYDCICGGSILNQAIVMTAAHCFDDFTGNKNQRIIVKYGSDDLNKMQMTVVNSYKIHEKYDFDTMYGDIALVRCKTPIQLGRVGKKVAIMVTPPNSRTGYVSGWGAINDNMDTSTFLKHTKQDIQDSRVCSQLNLPKGTFCAGPLNGPGRPGVGDSGSALVIEKYIQIGIVSYTVRSCTLVAYTNVSYYYPWITEHSRRLYCH